jgi:hypothetical protein
LLLATGRSLAGAAGKKQYAGFPSIIALITIYGNIQTGHIYGNIFVSFVN